MPHTMGMSARPRNRKPVSVNILLPDRRVPGRERAHRHRLPDGHERDPQQDLPQDEARGRGPAIGSKPWPPMWVSTVRHHPAPAHLAQAGEGHDDGADGQEDVLHVVRDDQRDHAPERGVGERDQKQRGHRPAEVLAGMPVTTARKRASMSGKMPRFSEPPTAIRTPASDAHVAAVATLEVLGDGQDLHLAQARDHEARAAHQQADRERDQAGHERGEARDEAELGLVHERDDPDLGREERRGAHVEAHAAVRDQVVLDRPDVPLHPEADPQRGHERQGRDPPVEEREARGDRGRARVAHRFRISKGTSWRSVWPATESVTSRRTRYSPGA